jgi:hypothetical protein
VDGVVTNGEVKVSGTSGILEGRLDDLYIASDRAASGLIELTGVLSIAATLTVGSETVIVEGDLLTLPTTGRLALAAPGGQVLWSGNATFNGAS